ncbi:MAG: hypothetical protein KKE83_11645 [Proteobacteria bacterium]|nr:hypothetical protein [Pseudomonadota bacterium]
MAWIPACAGMTLKNWLKISGNQKKINFGGNMPVPCMVASGNRGVICQRK